VSINLQPLHRRKVDYITTPRSRSREQQSCGHRREPQMGRLRIRAKSTGCRSSDRGRSSCKSEHAAG